MSNFTCRYGDSIMDLPDTLTMCKGQCEGMGFVPIAKDETEAPWRDLWLAAEAKKPTDDGWHFVRCPECNGTGKRPE